MTDLLVFVDGYSQSSVNSCLVCRVDGSGGRRNMYFLLAVTEHVRDVQRCSIFIVEDNVSKMSSSDPLHTVIHSLTDQSHRYCSNIYNAVSKLGLGNKCCNIRFSQ